jgi:tRNA A37 threonylcarbamoyladenosine dehydratase
MHSTIKISKAKVLAARLLDINPELDLTVKEVFIKEEITTALLESAPWDYVVDCIDTLSSKVFLIKQLECLQTQREEKVTRKRRRCRTRKKMSWSRLSESQGKCRRGLFGF